MTEALRLFLIEDDDDIALLIRKSLERVGHEVTRCRTAADALIVIGQTTFDLVLLDNLLPDMSGLDLLHTLAREGVTVPVLMVTGAGDQHLAASVLRAGALDYIVKDPALAFLGNLPQRVVESVKRHRLEQMNRLLIQALESARDGVVITDLQGVILSVNQALEQITGYGRQELLGQTPRLFKSKAHPPELYASLWRTILVGESWQGELTNRRKDGGQFQTSLTISPIVDPNGRLTHFVGIYRDVTEHKKLERQLLQAQKMQSVGTLAGGVAHEFNNLLAGINGYASLALREEAAGPEVRGFLQNVVDLSERAAALTRQLLAFARKPALSRQPTPMADLVRGTAELVTRTLRQEVGVEIEADNAETPLAVEADPNQLQQAMVNLALNARDALAPRESPPPDESAPASPSSPPPAASIVFRLRTDKMAEARAAFPQSVPVGDYVLLQVEDHGGGMTPDVLNQALDPFFTTKEVGQGTGLGLPMVFGIVQAHQGWLTIDSTPGQGTCVSIYLPRLTPTPGGECRSPSVRETVDVSPEAATGRSILVIDDEEAVLDVVRRFLEIAGHQVFVATSGREGLELLGGGKAVDLVILDLMMPREDATATFRRLRQRWPSLPVLLCTGLAEMSPAPELLLNPLVGLIRKPFRMDDLWKAVGKSLGEASVQ
jgi:two-component system, cell cycle sensor histidine kinase and response regulator CckA